MLNNFSPLLKTDSLNSNNDPDMYLIKIKLEQNAIRKLNQHARSSKDGAKHTEFIQEYYNLYQAHIDSITTNLQRIQSEELRELFMGTEETIPEEKIELDGYTYYATFGYEGWIFISPRGYDKYLEKDTYLILIYNQTPKGFRLAESAIGFTSLDIESLRNHPNYLEEQFKEFDKLTTVEKILEHYKKCLSLLLECFNVKEEYDLFGLEPSFRNKVFGEPLELLRTLNSKKTENIIQLCLNNNHVKSVTPELIGLVRKQLSINSISSDEEMLANEKVKNRLKTLEQ